MKVTCIVNAKSSRAAAGLKEIERCVSTTFKDSEVVKVTKPAELEKQAKKAIAIKPDVIIIAGGDGTIATLLNAAYELKFKGTVAIIPVGTSNYIARNLDIPIEIEAAVKLIKAKKTQKLYLPTLNGKLFSLMATIGLSTSVSKNIEVKQKQTYGQLAYVIVAVQQLFRHKGFEYELRADGDKEVHKGTTHQILLSNADLNMQFTFSPTSKLSEPTVRVVLYKTDDSKVRLLGSILLYMITVGRVRRNIVSISAKKVEIKTKPAKTLSVDGEIEGKTPAVIEAAKTYVNVIRG